VALASSHILIAKDCFTTHSTSTACLGRPDRWRPPSHPPHPPTGWDGIHQANHRSNFPLEHAVEGDHSSAAGRHTAKRLELAPHSWWVKFHGMWHSGFTSHAVCGFHRPPTTAQQCKAKDQSFMKVGVTYKPG
jgi:hypothetical protein